MTHSRKSTIICFLNLTKQSHEQNQRLLQMSCFMALKKALENTAFVVHSVLPDMAWNKAKLHVFLLWYTWNYWPAGSLLWSQLRELPPAVYYKSLALHLCRVTPEESSLNSRAVELMNSHTQKHVYISCSTSNILPWITQIHIHVLASLQVLAVDVFLKAFPLLCTSLSPSMVGINGDCFLWGCFKG